MCKSRCKSHSEVGVYDSTLNISQMHVARQAPVRHVKMLWFLQREALVRSQLRANVSCAEDQALAQDFHAVGQAWHHNPMTPRGFWCCSCERSLARTPLPSIHPHQNCKYVPLIIPLSKNVFKQDPNRQRVWKHNLTTYHTACSN